MSKLFMLAVALGLATITFWVVIIASSPASQAATETNSERAELAKADPCVTFGICP